MKRFLRRFENAVLRRTVTVGAALTAAGSLIALSSTVNGAFAQSKKTGPITTPEVKAFFTDLWTHDCAKSDACTVTFDSPVKIAPATSHTFQIPPVTYTCYPVKVDFTFHPNRGAQMMHFTRAVYYFHRNSFGDWEMGKENERVDYEKDAPKATGQKTPDVAPVKGGADGKNQKQTAKTTTKTANSGYPKPDFSEMEDYFDIVKYEYPKPPSKEMWIYFKPKEDSKDRPMFFNMQFRDKDGILIGGEFGNGNGIKTYDLATTAKGEMGKTSLYIPSEKEMESVVSAKVIRVKQ